MLEQRISRAHRMGQRRPVQVFVLVTEVTIEDNLLATLLAKHELALASLDPASQVDQVDLVSWMEELKRRLEILLGAKPEAPLDESQRIERQQEANLLARKQKIAAAGGQLFIAAFGFLGELVPHDLSTAELQQMAAFFKERLAECVEPDESEQPKLTISLPDAAALDQITNALARLLAGGKTAAMGVGESQP